MKIGIFPACLGRRDAGPETYERELIVSLSKLPGGHEFHVFCFTQAAGAAIGDTNGNVRRHTLWPGIRPISMSLALPLMLAKTGVRVYHATFVPAPLCGTKAVFTMHDVSPFTRPEFYPERIRRRLAPLIRRGLETAKLIVCVSENCLETTHELFGVSRSQLVVAPHGIGESFHPVAKPAARQRVAERFGLDGPFMLYVGKLEARKNICRLLRAFHQFRRDTGSDARLALVGRRFWDLGDMDKTIAQLGLRGAVVELGYVGGEDLAPLYSAAEVFVFPSLWEGFGFPVLEAMKCGTPVVTSNVSCLPEVAGGAAELVDPESVGEIAAAMARLMGDPGLRERRSRQGVAQAAKFSWPETARRTLAAYERAAEM